MTGRRPRLLTIAGSDSGGGAGIQADLRTFSVHGGHGMSVVTAITAQNTVGVTAVHGVPPEVVAAQIDAVLSDLGADAIKIGMLADAGIVDTVAAGLGRWRSGGEPPVVLDPVMVAKSGDALLADSAVAALRDRLAPLATLITPNLPEAERLAGRAVRPDDEDDRVALGRELARRLGEAGPAVLLKGGHAAGEEVVDLLIAGDAVHRFAHARVETTATHGTGCTLSAAIAARLGRGETLVDAVGGSIAYLHEAIRRAEPMGSGHGPVDHLWPLAGATA